MHRSCVMLRNMIGVLHQPRFNLPVNIPTLRPINCANFQRVLIAQPLGQRWCQSSSRQNAVSIERSKDYFTRPWDLSCPRVWDSWEDAGKQWVIQDLPPEDDEAALKIFLTQFCPDEVLCVHNNIVRDSESMRGIADIWRKYIAKRTTLACYVEENGQRQLASVNICMVMCEDEDPEDEIHGETWNNIYDVLTFVEAKADMFKHMGLKKILYALGLVVVREYRGMGIGARVLAAREPLSRHLDIKGTAAIFTGPVSQKCGKRAGFKTIATVNMKELAEAGLIYPRDDSRKIKLMIMKYNQ